MAQAWPWIQAEKELTLKWEAPWLFQPLGPLCIVLPHGQLSPTSSHRQPCTSPVSRSVNGTDEDGWAHLSEPVDQVIVKGDLRALTTSCVYWLGSLDQQKTYG